MSNKNACEICSAIRKMGFEDMSYKINQDIISGSFFKDFHLHKKNTVYDLAVVFNFYKDSDD